MKVYIVEVHYSDYDEGWDRIVSVHDSEVKAQVAKLEAEQASKVLHRKGRQWTKFDNHEWSVTEYEVL